MTPVFADISACVFDAYGTLFDVGAIAATAQAALGPKGAEVVALVRRKQLEYTWVRTLMGRHADFWHVTGDAMDYAFKTFAVVDPLLRARLMDAWLAPKPFADAAPTLSALRAAGQRTAILSNGSPTMLAAAVKAAGLDQLIDRVMSVEAAGVFKPHAAVYKLACDQLDLDRNRIAFFSANGWDVAGAANFGFRVAWINRAHAPRDALPGEAEEELSSLAEICDLFAPE